MEGEIRTDLALEVQERFTEDDVEVKGVGMVTALIGQRYPSLMALGRVYS